MTYYTLFNLTPSTRKERVGETFDVLRYPDGIQISRQEDGIVEIGKYPFPENELHKFWQPSDSMEWDIAVELLKEEVNNL